jgi:hypothetical protein
MECSQSQRTSKVSLDTSMHKDYERRTTDFRTKYLIALDRLTSLDNNTYQAIALYIYVCIKINFFVMPVRGLCWLASLVMLMMVTLDNEHESYAVLELNKNLRSKLTKPLDFPIHTYRVYLFSFCPFIR